ncbi:MAG: hypothetical protein K6E11_04465 [Bacilli bacterium]|nr:hypothetical protein [Bacilli bacterium]
MGDMLFLIIILGALLLGGILFVLTGFINVRKGRVAIIEKAGEFVGIYREGTYYFAPIVYRRVGMYSMGEISETYLINRIDYKVTYEIIDVMKYHYEGHHDMYGLVKASLVDSKDHLSDALKTRANAIGVRFIKLEKIKSSR